MLVRDCGVLVRDWGRAVGDAVRDAPRCSRCPSLVGVAALEPGCFFWLEAAVVSCCARRWREGTALAGSVGLDGVGELGNPVDTVYEPG